MEHDVIIVGAGPAGSTTARFCAKKGLKTLLVEKNRVPRYKPCGGCLSPRVLKALDFDIAEVIESTISEVKFTFQLEDPFSIVSSNPIGYLVTRDSFDHLLCRKAQEVGTDLYEGRRVVGFQQDAEGVDVSTNRGESIRCRYLVGADGAGSIVAQSLHRGVMKKTGMALEGRGCLVSGIRKRRSFVHLDLGAVPHGYGWIFPKGNFVSIGIAVLLTSKGMKLRSRFERFMGSVDYIRGVKVGKAYSHPLPTFSNNDLPFSKGRVLLVGDAANLIDPMTGEGIYYAIRSGQMAGETIVKAIKEGKKWISGYREALEYNLIQDLTVALKLAKAIDLFPSLAYTILKSNKNLGLLYLRMLAGDAHYRAFSREMIDGIRGRQEKKYGHDRNALGLRAKGGYSLYPWK